MGLLGDEATADTGLFRLVLYYLSFILSTVGVILFAVASDVVGEIDSLAVGEFDSLAVSEIGCTWPFGISFKKVSIISMSTASASRSFSYYLIKIKYKF